MGAPVTPSNILPRAAARWGVVGSTALQPQRGGTLVSLHHSGAALLPPGFASNILRQRRGCHYARGSSIPWLLVTQVCPAAAQTQR